MNLNLIVLKSVVCAIQRRGRCPESALIEQSDISEVQIDKTNAWLPVRWDFLLIGTIFSG